MKEVITIKTIFRKIASLSLQYINAFTFVATDDQYLMKKKIIQVISQLVDTVATHVEFYVSINANKKKNNRF